jgi:hypothetical protein
MRFDHIRRSALAQEDRVGWIAGTISAREGGFPRIDALKLFGKAGCIPK